MTDGLLVSEFCRVSGDMSFFFFFSRVHDYRAGAGTLDIIWSSVSQILVIMCHDFAIYMSNCVIIYLFS